MVRYLMIACLAVSFSMGCAPLTFSKDEAIDFAAYPVVRVQVRDESHENLSATAYLADELSDKSGFSDVTYEANAGADALLLVDLRVIDASDDSFEAIASYRLLDADGQIVDEGDVDTTSATFLEAEEDALDEIALHYHRPYRI